MTTLEQNRALIIGEINSDDSEVRAQYMAEFEGDVAAFADAMAQAMVEWSAIDSLVSGNKKKGYVVGIAFAALALHTTSMKLLLSGHLVTAGNLTRQVVECIAMAVLCSARDMDVLSRFMEDKYSAKNAVRDVLRHAKNFTMNVDAFAALQPFQEFYHQHSHLSRMTLAAMLSFSGDGTYIGGSFDAGKIEAYRTEVSDRVSLAKVLPSIYKGVGAQLGAW